MIKHLLPITCPSAVSVLVTSVLNIDLCSNTKKFPPPSFCCMFSRANPAIYIPPVLLSIGAALGSVLGLHLHILKNVSSSARHFQQLIGAFEFKMESLSIHLTTLLAAKSNGLNYLWVTSENCNDSGILPRDFRN